MLIYSKSIQFASAQSKKEETHPMPDKLHKSLHLRTDEVLYFLWDPIGINDEPQ